MTRIRARSTRWMGLAKLTAEKSNEFNALWRSHPFIAWLGKKVKIVSLNVFGLRVKFQQHPVEDRVFI